jgi:hypothetical protein
MSCDTSREWHVEGSGHRLIANISSLVCVGSGRHADSDTGASEQSHHHVCMHTHIYTDTHTHMYIQVKVEDAKKYDTHTHMHILIVFHTDIHTEEKFIEINVGSTK